MNRLITGQKSIVQDEGAPTFHCMEQEKDVMTCRAVPLQTAFPVHRNQACSGNKRGPGWAFLHRSFLTPCLSGILPEVVREMRACAQRQNTPFNISHAIYFSTKIGMFSRVQEFDKRVWRIYGIRDTIPVKILASLFLFWIK